MKGRQMQVFYLLRGVALLDEGGPNRSWSNGIHSDTSADQVWAQPLCECGHSSLQQHCFVLHTYTPVEPVIVIEQKAYASRLVTYVKPASSPWLL